MDYNFIWQAILIVLMGTLLLRFSGRKTISEMTLAETVLMISFGTLIIQPVTSKSVWKSFLVGIVLVGTLLILEFGQVKSERLERLITGKAKIIIENGKINETELTKLHMTVDQLEMHLRQNNVTSIQDVKWATIEPSGRLGFTLKEDALPATKADMKQLQRSIDLLINQQSQLENLHNRDENKQNDNIFTEIKNEGHKNETPKRLQ